MTNEFSVGRTLRRSQWRHLCYETFGKPTDPAAAADHGPRRAHDPVGRRIVRDARRARLPCHPLRQSRCRAVNQDRCAGADVAAALSAVYEGQPAKPPYSLEDMARDAPRVAGSSRRARAHVVGFSLGGMIAQVMALDAPERVASLTLIATRSGEPDLPAPGPEFAAIFAAPPPRDVGRIYRGQCARLEGDASGLDRPAGGCARSGARRTSFAPLAALPGGRRPPVPRRRHRPGRRSRLAGSRRRRWSSRAPPTRYARPRAAKTWRARSPARSSCWLSAWATTCRRRCGRNSRTPLPRTRGEACSRGRRPRLQKKAPTA